MDPVTDDEEARAATDPRFAPLWYHVTFGAVIALALGLARISSLFTLAAVALIGVLELVRRRRHPVIRDERSRIALHVPLPGFGFTMAVLAIVIFGHGALAGLLVPRDVIPTTAAVVVAVALGALSGVLLRKAELRQLAAVRRLEADDDA